MEISGTIYEGVVEPSYKITTRGYNNHDGHNRKMIGVSASSKAYYKIGKCSGKRKQIYEDSTIYRSKLTCLIHGHVHFS